MVHRVAVAAAPAAAAAAPCRILFPTVYFEMVMIGMKISFDKMEQETLHHAALQLHNHLHEHDHPHH